MFITQLIAWFHAELAKLVSLFHHHAAAGTLPDVSLPSVAPTGKELPMPAPAPAPVAYDGLPAAHAVNPVYPVDGIASYVDSDGCIRIKALDELRVSEPRIAARFFIKDIAENPARFNATPAQGKVAGTNCNIAMFDNNFAGGNPNAPWWTAAVFTDDGPGGTMRQGAQLDGAIAFNGDNIIHGVVAYEGVSLANLPALIERWKANGLLPIIDHQPGVVAH